MPNAPGKHLTWQAEKKEKYFNATHITCESSNWKTLEEEQNQE